MVGVLEQERQGEDLFLRDTRSLTILKQRRTEKTTRRHLAGKLVEMKDKKKNP